jgi:hypothetical protein
MSTTSIPAPQPFPPPGLPSTRPALWGAILLGILFAPLGVIASIVQASRARRLGFSVTRYWVTCGVFSSVLLLAVVLVVAASSAPSGFNNPAALATSIQSTFNSAKNVAEDGYSVSATSCIQNGGGNTFTCIFTESGGGGQQTVTVTVAADGQSWISHA